MESAFEKAQRLCANVAQTLQRVQSSRDESASASVRGLLCVFMVTIVAPKYCTEDQLVADLASLRRHADQLESLGAKEITSARRANAKEYVFVALFQAMLRTRSADA